MEGDLTLKDCTLRTGTLGEEVALAVRCEWLPRSGKAERRLQKYF